MVLVFWAFVLVLVGVASGLEVLSRAMRAPPRGLVDGPAPGPAAGPHLTTLTDRQLALAWQMSQQHLDALVDADLSEAAARLAGERCVYLDELERRHPDGFRAWLASGDAGEFPSDTADGVR
jgi:hypothetical protein